MESQGYMYGPHLKTLGVGVREATDILVLSSNPDATLQLFNPGLLHDLPESALQTRKDILYSVAWGLRTKSNEAVWH